MDLKQLESKVFVLEKRIVALESRASKLDDTIEGVRREVANEVEGPLQRRIDALEARAVKDDIIAKVNKITQDIAAMKK